VCSLHALLPLVSCMLSTHSVGHDCQRPWSWNKLESSQARSSMMLGCGCEIQRGCQNDSGPGERHHSFCGHSFASVLVTMQSNLQRSIRYDHGTIFSWEVLEALCVRNIIQRKATNREIENDRVALLQWCIEPSLVHQRLESWLAGPTARVVNDRSLKVPSAIE